jgi:hypothetical protein
MTSDANDWIIVKDAIIALSLLLSQTRAGTLMAPRFILTLVEQRQKEKWVQSLSALLRWTLAEPTSPSARTRSASSLVLGTVLRWVSNLAAAPTNAISPSN